jgi:hypothetical protein
MGAQHDDLLAGRGAVGGDLDPPKLPVAAGGVDAEPSLAGGRLMRTIPAVMSATWLAALSVTQNTGTLAAVSRCSVAASHRSCSATTLRSARRQDHRALIPKFAAGSR